VANDENKSFEQYFNEFSKSLAQTAFPQLSKFMSFDSSKKQDEDRASKSVDDQEEEDTPRRRANKSVNAVANEMVLDALGGIDERLKIQSIVLVSQLEQQTLTNQLLNRLASDGSGFGGGGAGGGNKVVNAVEDAVGGAAIWNFVKTMGKTVLGGAGAAAGLGAAAAGSLIYGDISGNAGIKKIYDKGEPDPTSAEIQEMQAEANKPRIAANNTQIKDMEDTISKIEQHLKISNAGEEERAKQTAITVELQKKINELQKQNIELAKPSVAAATTNSGPHGVVGPSGTSGKEPVADVPTAVSTPMEGSIPVNTGGAIDVPTGESPLSMVRSGKYGMAVGGGGDRDAYHPAGTGGARSTGGGRGSGGKASGAGSAQNKSEAWAFFKSKGYSDEETAAIMGNLQQESQFNPGAFNPKDVHNSDGSFSPSEGIAQWNDGKDGKTQRRSNMMKFVSEQFGKPYNELSASEKYTGQLGFIDNELRTKYQDAMKSLKSGDYKRFGHQYEGYGSPPDEGGENTRENNRLRLLREGQAGQFANNGRPEVVSPQGAGGLGTVDLGNGDVMDKIAKARQLGLVNGDDCVALAAGAVGVRLDGAHGIGSNVHDWRRGSDVLGSNLKPGTAVATFLNPDGSPSDRYAGGGSGVRGAHRDHAGVIVGYDKDGKGFTLADQWAAHGGHEKAPEGHMTHVANGGIDPRTGRYNAELDPKNYAAVMAGGRYLGNSPMNVRESVHRGPSGPNNLFNRYRPEDDKNANLDANIADDAKYKADMDAYNEQVLDSRRGISGYGRHTDKGETVAGAFVKNVNADAMNDAAAKTHAAAVNSTVTNTQGLPGGHLTGPHKSDRMSHKEVGSPNPPSTRLKELFTTTENGKGF
jgi:hypothetical protein